MGRWTLRAKWTAFALGVSLVPTVVLGLVVLDIQRRGLARAEKELEAAVVDEAAAAVIASLDEAADVAARVDAVFADERVDPDSRARLIGDVVARAPATIGVAFFDANGRFVDAVVQKGADPAALRVPPSGRRGFSDFRHEAPLGGAVRGTLVVAVSRASLDARLRDLSKVRFGAPDRVYLVDEASKSAHALTASAAAPSFTNEVLVTTEFEEGGIAKVGTIRTMPAQRLALVVERPTDEAFGALASARRAFVGVVAGFAALAALTALLVVRRFAKSDREIARRARIEENLKRYLPAPAAEAAAANGDAEGSGGLALGGAKRRVTVLFADVVAFTGFAERATPEKAVAFLNELFTILSEIVFRHDGMVDKFIGDCVMAVFQGDDGTARALAAAEDMHAFVESNQPRWRDAYAFDVKLGIGVAAGDVLLGNLGSSTRMEYTVIGDAVNVAARLEMLARPKQTLATKEVALACPDITFTSLGEHALRGKAQPVEVFEVAS